MSELAGCTVPSEFSANAFHRSFFVRSATVYFGKPLVLSSGSRLGAYEIVAAIGAGGMGEVYRATDTNLKRAVAIRWMAFQSDESGQPEIYVQPFLRPGQKVRISAAGGVQARWRPDGKELFYLAPDQRLMAVPIQLDAEFPNGVEVGTPVALFTTSLAGVPQGGSSRHYIVSRDGQRFLMDTLREVTVPITVVLNWKPRP